MELLRIPRRRVHTRILLDDGRSLEGELYTAPAVTAGRPESVLEHLNDPTEDFMPLAVGEDRFVLNKAGILYAQLDGDPTEAGEHLPEAAHVVPVRLTLAGGMGLLGRFHVVMPPERSRVLDYLNAAPRFLPLWRDGQVTLVQRSFIVSVRSELREE
jgi:hypothetical protein